MLYCIWKGFDVQRRPQKDIIYLISSIEKLHELNIKYIFTDGHSFAAYTQFFNNSGDLNQIDWKTVNLINWSNTPDDPDKKRRKEAECLVYKELPFDALQGIVVYNDEANDYILKVLNKNQITLPVKIISGWYY